MKGVGSKEMDEIKKWAEKSTKEKLLTVLKILLKTLGILGCLYFFICSLDLMSSAFRLLGGRYAAQAFKSNVILTNPIAGLVIGIIVTVVVQSSSTSTSIIVSMVASEIIQVKYAIPIIMGANIGTSVTSTLVAFGQLGNKEDFRRAFAGATVHDMFNILSVSVILPLEIATGFLDKSTGALVRVMLQQNLNVKEPEMLNAITKPLTNLIIQLDKNVLEEIGSVNASVNETAAPMIKHFCQVNDGQSVRCPFLFEGLNWPEWGIGLLLLLITLIVLCGCLVLMVKILNSIFKGPVADLLQKVVNSDFPGVFKHFTGYFAILIGCCLTIVIQSSSVFTSTLTPLVGMGLVSLERMYPLALGSNIGTTVTGILAALSASPKTLKYSLQIALCHTIFNITGMCVLTCNYFTYIVIIKGIIIWYPIPVLRRLPLKLARLLGDISAKYRWFTLLYILVVFFIAPVVIFALSIAGWIYLVMVLCPFILLLLAVVVIHILQRKYPKCLPPVLRNWYFLPVWLRSLRPYDKFLVKYILCCKQFKPSHALPLTQLNASTNEMGQQNEKSISSRRSRFSNKGIKLEERPSVVKISYVNTSFVTSI